MSARKVRDGEVATIRRPQPRPSEQSVAGATERRLSGAMEVPIDQIVPDPAQPRRSWDDEESRRRLAELAESIREFGVLQPLLVREGATLPDGRQGYIIIAGGRRRAAAGIAGQATLPVVVRGDGAARLRIVQLIENVQRQDLSPLDEARAYQEIIESEGYSARALAGRLHISDQHVRDRIRLLADQVLADAVERRQLSATAAREIKKLPNDEVMEFRQRVLRGERLQTNDVAAARARLEASGIINPRRRGPGNAGASARASTGVSAGAVETSSPAAPSLQASLESRATRQESPQVQTSFEQDRPRSLAPRDGREMAGVQTTFEQDESASHSTPQDPPPSLDPLETSGRERMRSVSHELRLGAERAAALVEEALVAESRDEFVRLLSSARRDGLAAAWWQHVFYELEERLRVAPAEG